LGRDDTRNAGMKSIFLEILLWQVAQKDYEKDDLI
jgi:hypothetical protein